jgi:DNA-binding XRE family transcriptional regulator
MTPEELKIEMFIHRKEAAAPVIARRLGVSRTLVYLVRDGKAVSFPVACEIARSIGRPLEDVFPGKYSQRLDECPTRCACN